MILFPDRIKKIIGNCEYERNDVGMSDSKVLMFPEYVLKIQRLSPETKNEKDIITWLDKRLPVPQIAEYYVEDDTAYTLMTRIKGKMLCDEEFLNNPEMLINLAADGLKRLWNVDVSDCPCKVSRLEERLKAAEWNIENGQVDLDNVEPETFGPNGFANPTELLLWLKNNKPDEDIVLSHGDFCLPNIFADNNQISGFIDLGKMGPADRWQDVAIALRSLEHNFSGRYNGGKAYYKFEPEMLLNKLGMKMDEEKNRYYMLLDELF